MDFLFNQIDSFLQRIGHGPGDRTILSSVLDSFSSEFGWGSDPDEMLQYAATSIGISSAAFIVLMCFRYISAKDNSKEQAAEDKNAIEKTSAQQLMTTPKPIRSKIKRQNLLNLKRHELKNFIDESELETFYNWRETLTPSLEFSEIEESDDDNLTDRGLAAAAEPSNDTSTEKISNDSSVFDSLYRKHSYLPPFVKIHIAVEKYTEDQLAALKVDKSRHNIHYTLETLSYRVLMDLVDHDMIPIDISPDKITDLVVKNERLSNEDVLNVLSMIYDLCIKNKIAEWSLHYRKCVQPYFRNRHYRKQFQTRPVNDLLQDIQTYYNTEDENS